MEFCQYTNTGHEYRASPNGRIITDFHLELALGSSRWLAALDDFRNWLIRKAA